MGVHPRGDGMRPPQENSVESPAGPAVGAAVGRAVGRAAHAADASANQPQLKYIPLRL